MNFLESSPLSIADIDDADAEILTIYLVEAHIAAGIKCPRFVINVRQLAELYLDSALIQTEIILKRLMHTANSTRR